ncbi:MAG: alpha/beta hydrolase [Oscillospiraceae bacterium]|nr:alpha/beta hydrolase [Oscillospiraceae bacterium]
MKRSSKRLTHRLAKLSIGACALSCASACYFFYSVILRKPEKPRRHLRPLSDMQKDHLQKREDALAWLETMGPETIHITSKDGLGLTGHFLPAAVPTDKTILAIHGYRSNGRKEYAVFARFYHELGYNLLMPDDRAHGESEGRYIGFGWLDREDCKQWIAWLKQRFGPDAQVLLHGISMGAATVLMAAGDGLDPAVKGVIADCSYSGVWDEFAYQAKHSFHIPCFPVLSLANLISRAIAGYDYKTASVKEQTKKIKVPVLFIHGTKDTYVPTAMVHELFAACRAPKHLLLVNGAVHADSYLTDTPAYEAAVAAHLERCGMSAQKI